MKISLLKSQKGQAAVEYILLMVVAVAISITVSNYIRSNDTFQSVIRGPWQSLSGMLQNGAWGSPQRTMVFHPNHVNRLSSTLIEGDDL